MERVTVKDAAALLGLHPYTVRYWMETGRLPIGRVIKGKKKNSYLIYRELLEREVGKR
jgi:excisionase family DNA binding protein